jgi:hypothetical protein
MTMLLAPVKRRPQEAESGDGAAASDNSGPPQAEAS